jgi:hypothetical protein
MGRQRSAAVEEHWGFTTAADMARKLPQPYAQISDLQLLTQRESESFAECEAAVENLKWAFWAAGKALQIIRDGRLYRATHEVFEDYVLTRWNMQRNYANKLIRTWRIAEALFEQESNGLVPMGTTKNINQRQMWELVAVAETWAIDRAVWVYRTMQGLDVPMTAQVLGGAVKALKALPPSETFDENAAESAILDYVAGLDAGRPEPDPTLRVRRLVKGLDTETIRAAARDPQTRALLRELLAVLDEYDDTAESASA